MRWFLAVALVICFSFSSSFAQEGAISEQRISEEVVSTAPAGEQNSSSEDTPSETVAEEVSEEPQEPVEDSTISQEESPATEESPDMEEDQSS